MVKHCYSIFIDKILITKVYNSIDFQKLNHIFAKQLGSVDKKLFGLCPTGTFQTSSKHKESFYVLPELKLSRNIDWPGGSVPLSTPLCGFEVRITKIDIMKISH